MLGTDLLTLLGALATVAGPPPAPARQPRPRQSRRSSPAPSARPRSANGKPCSSASSCPTSRRWTSEPTATCSGSIAPKAGWPAIASFVELESRCCAFLDFEIRVESASDRIALVLSGPDGTKEFLKPLIEKRGGRRVTAAAQLCWGSGPAPARGRDRRAEDLEDLVEEEDVGEQSPQVERGVEVVHQLGADPGLSQHQAHRRQRLARVVGQHPLEVLVLGARGDRLRRRRSARTPPAARRAPRRERRARRGCGLPRGRCSRPGGPGRRRPTCTRRRTRRCRAGGVGRLVPWTCAYVTREWSRS